MADRLRCSPLPAEPPGRTDLRLSPEPDSFTTPRMRFSTTGRALRNATGVGEYVHQARPRPSNATGIAGRRLTFFSSSWKDRPSSATGRAGLPRVVLLDLRLPVRVLNCELASCCAGRRSNWLTRRTDSTWFTRPTRCWLPSRHSAQVITIHDLDFLSHPERTDAEIRRDYPRLVTDHARRADRILVPSAHTAAQVHHLLGIPAEHVSICPEGAPDWVPLPVGSAGGDRHGYVLFVGTLEPRKNVPALSQPMNGLPGGARRRRRWSWQARRGRESPRGIRPS